MLRDPLSVILRQGDTVAPNFIPLDRSVEYTHPFITSEGIFSINSSLFDPAHRVVPIPPSSA